MSVEFETDTNLYARPLSSSPAPVGPGRLAKLIMKMAGLSNPAQANTVMIIIAVLFFAASLLILIF